MTLFSRLKPARTLNLALQGGGAHGAFTWGALDGLLADATLRIEGVSGTSAGAMNAVCLAQGWLEDGAAGATRALARFWTAVADRSPFPAGADHELLGAPLRAMLQWSEYFSPAQFNPFDLNPLRDILDQQIDFAALRRRPPFKLFIAATHANSGKLRLFREHELRVEHVLASACLPTIHHTVEIDGEPYWDGGYSANPAIFPLLHDCRADDILLILLAPLHYAETPYSATDIRLRLREISFNNAFLREMRMYAHLQEHLGTRWLSLGKLDRQLRRCRFHAIDAGQELGALPANSKLNTDPAFFRRLHDLGLERAGDWLRRHRSALGRRASLNLAALFY